MILLPGTTTMWHRMKTAMVPSVKSCWSRTSSSSSGRSSSCSGRLKQSVSPSSSSDAAGPSESSDSLLESNEAVMSKTSRTSPIPHPEEPNIYLFPEGLNPEYRPLPILMKVLVGTLSLLLAAPASSFQKMGPTLRAAASLHPMEFLVRCASTKNLLFWKRMVGTLVKTMLWYVLASSTLQEAFPKTRPSRISTNDLATNFYLPSPLSRYEIVENEDENGGDESSSKRKVHWIEYKHAASRWDTASDTSTTTSVSSTQRKNRVWDAVYLNHGFGASSLSWLPVLPSLAQRLRVPSILGHDAPGFGFADRPNDDGKFYSLQTSARIGSTILKKHLVVAAAANACGEENIFLEATAYNNSNQSRTILLMGHSMGCLTTLRLALLLNDPDIHLRIILVAPALGLSKKTSRSNSSSKKKKRLSSSWRKRITQPFKVVSGVIAAYILRRVVGRPNFWRNGLRQVWGDPKRLRDSDVLRFQWPSVGKGWERGLLQFTKARLQEEDEWTDDQRLLQAVLNLPNARSVDVIVSSKDKVVPAGVTRKFLENFPDVSIVEMEGTGHDPFEEDVDYFVTTVEQILEKKEC